MVAITAIIGVLAYIALLACIAFSGIVLGGITILLSKKNNTGSKLGLTTFACILISFSLGNSALWLYDSHIAIVVSLIVDGFLIFFCIKELMLAKNLKTTAGKVFARIIFILFLLFGILGIVWFTLLW